MCRVLKDLGGGGLTCCISEMAAKGGNGANVELAKYSITGRRNDSL